MLKLHDVNKVYRTDDVETTALNNVNIEIESGEYVAVMGPSGCGKSTLLNVVGLLDTITSGRYHFGEEDVSNYSERRLADIRKSNIGFIFQSFNLIDELSVYENVELALLYQGVPAKERKVRVSEVLERMNIAHRGKHLPQQLSGGQQQRVAISRAVVGAPTLLLADEPTGNLDSANGDEVMDILQGLNADGTTIVMVTHSSSHAEHASRIINLFDGSVVMDDVMKL